MTGVAVLLDVHGNAGLHVVLVVHASQKNADDRLATSGMPLVTGSLMSPTSNLTTELSLVNAPVDEAFSRLKAHRDVIRASSDETFLAHQASLLPQHVSTLSPELQMLLASLAHDLAAYVLNLPDDIGSTPFVVRVAWLRAALARPTAELPPLSTTDWIDVLQGHPVEDVARADVVLSHCLALEDESLSTLVLRWIPRLLCSLRLSPDDAVVHLTAGLSLSTRTRFTSLELLRTKELKTVAPETRVALARPFVDDEEPAVVRAALAVLADAKTPDICLSVAADTSRNDVTRDAAVRATHRNLQRPHLSSLLALAVQSPLAVGDACRTVILEAHRRGVFVEEVHAGMLLDAFDSCPSWAPDELARVCFTVRDAFVAETSKLHTDDARWQRRTLALALVPQPDVVPLLSQLLTTATKGNNIVAFIRAASHCEGFDDEDAVLRHLELFPLPVLEALRFKGGKRTLEVLAQRLRQDNGLGSARSEAACVFYELHEDEDVAFRLLSQAPQPQRTLAKIRRCPQVSSSWQPQCSLDGLVALGTFGDEQHREQAKAIVRQELARLCSQKRSLLGREERQQLDEDLENLRNAARAFGARLVARRRRVQHFKKYRSDDRDWFRLVLTEWLDEEPSDDLVCMLLQELALAGTDVQPGLLRWLRSKNAEVRAMAARTCMSTAEHNGVGFAHSLVSLANESNEKVLRQGLLAIEEHQLGHAEPLVVNALGHRNMNVKRAAAVALQTMGSFNAAGTLVDVLAAHDNAGLRADALLALVHCAGAITDALLLSALGTSTTARSRGLLVDALSGRLSSTQVAGLMSMQHPSVPTLLNAFDAGELKVQDAAALRRLLKATNDDCVEDAEMTPSEAILAFGFTETRAADVLVSLEEDAGPTPPSVLRAVQSRLAEWTAWAVTGAADRPLASQLALEAATLCRPGPDLLASLSTCAAAAAMTAPAVVLTWCERLEARHHDDADLFLLQLMRAEPFPLPQQGRRHWDVLGRLGGVRTTADLKASVATCATHHLQRLLRDGLSSLPQDGWQEWWRAYAHAPHDEKDQLLQDALERFPLGRASVDSVDLPATPRRTKAERLKEHLRQLTTSEDRAQRRQAFQALLSADELRHAAGERQLLDAFLNGAVSATGDEQRRLSTLLEEWPVEAEQQQRARTLLSWLAPEQIRRWLPAWMKAVDEGDDVEAESLAFADRNDIIDLAAELGMTSFASAAVVEEDTPKEADDTVDISHLGAEELRCFAMDNRDEASVAAVQELTRREEVAELQHITTHRQWRIRNAALRGLSKVGTREVYLDAAVQMFLVEEAKAPLRRLTRIVCHGRRLDAAPKLLQLLTSSDPHTHQMAVDGLVALGTTVLPLLRKAEGRARPDRRALFAAVREELKADASATS